MRKPLVLDADALNQLAECGPAGPAGSVLTPIPERREAAGRADLECADRSPRGLRRLCQHYPGAIVVLKGAGRSSPQHSASVALCERGNPGMATAAWATC